MDDREDPVKNTPVPVAEDNPEYFEAVPPNPDDQVVTWRCKECRETAQISTVSIQHKPLCMVWLRIRVEVQIVRHPKLKFQVGKLVQIPVSGSYPVYVAHLVAPFLYESGSALTDDYAISMLDARAPIKMTKAEIKDELRRDTLFKERRIDATHKLLDFVEAGEVPVIKDSRAGAQGIGQLKVWQWGTLQDWHEEIQKIANRQKGIIAP